MAATTTETHPLRRPHRSGPTLVLFDGEQAEELNDLDDAPSRLGRSQFLWIDTDELTAELAERLASALRVDERRAHEMLDDGVRGFRDGCDFVRVGMRTPTSDASREVARLTCVVGDHWALTAHDRPVGVLDDLAELAVGSGPTGELSGPSFLAMLFEWVLNGYSLSFEEIEEELERLDERAMRGRGEAETHIESLVDLRRRAGRLRRDLSSHRTALLALTQPELEALGDDQEADRFRRLLEQYDSAMQTARDARSSVVSSFDVLIARTGHQTNEIMKVLTLASVLLLPGALLAGVLGMNFKVSLFAHTWLFWVVIALIAAFAAVTVAVAKRRRWI
ncbi:MAG TPA: CorA family divalent cation transporter [Gaiella sp.]